MERSPGNRSTVKMVGKAKCGGNLLGDGGTNSGESPQSGKPEDAASGF